MNAPRFILPAASGATVCALVFFTQLPLFAQPVSPQGGGPLPEAYFRVLQDDPTAFTFERAYIRQVQRLKENRRLYEAGLLRLPGGGAAPPQLLAVTGTRNVPVFLGKYSNTGANPISRADLQQELFDGPWPKATTKQETMTAYYREISYGNLQLAGTVYDWVTTAKADTYYAGTNYGLNPSNTNTDEFITEILTANDSAVDFSQYDNDGADGLPDSGDDDGYVDFIGIVHPESGGECSGAPTSDIWSHRWKLSSWSTGEFTTNDARTGGGNIKINDYTIMPALSKSFTPRPGTRFPRPLWAPEAERFSKS